MEAHSSNVECKYNVASNEADIICDWCQSMIDYNPQKGWYVPLTPSEHERAIALFGGPTVHSSGRWKRLANSLGATEHADWARLSSPFEDPITQLPCSEVEFEELHQSVVQGLALTNQQQRWLSKGIEFHDGSCFRMIDGRQYMDDVELPSIVSTRSLFPVLASKDLRQGWDISALIVGLSSTTPFAQREVHDFFGGFESADPNTRAMTAMLSWLSTRVKIDRLKDEDNSPRAGFVSWAYDVRSEVLRRGGRVNRTKLSEAFSNHPNGLLDCYRVPWMKDWNAPSNHHLSARTLKWPLRVSEKHISLRVRNQAGRTRMVQIPRQPVHWAIFVSLSLSPLNSVAGKTLLGIQHNWSRPYTKNEPLTNHMIRSLEFCHGILNGLSDRVFLKNAEVLVIGKLGHCYEIKVAQGQHGAPYLISHVRDFGRVHNHPICIHNGQYHSTVPIGDTMGSVLLSMYNDTTAINNINSLNEVLCDNPPFGFSRSVNEDWMATLDQAALKNLSASAPWGRNTWFARHHRDSEIDNEREIPQRNRGIHDLLARQFRNTQRVETRVSKWNEVFKQHFEETGEFPFNEVIESWAEEVRPYTSNNQFQRRPNMQAQQYGRWGRMAMRYRQIAIPRNRDDVHEVGDMRDGERRWGEVYARVWRALISQPIGSVARMPNTIGGVLNFDEVDLQVTVRNNLERRFVNSITQLLGYVRDGEEEDYTLYLRRDHPRPNARLRLTDLLADTQRRQNVRGAPPRWWNYADACRAPDKVERYPWQLHQDLTDTPRQRNQQGEFDDGHNDLDELFG